MISRAAGVIAMLLMAVPGCEVRAQIYLYPYPPPSTPPYRAPADTYIDRSPQVPDYRSRSGAWEPRAGTEANAGGAPVQGDPRAEDPRNNDSRFSALPLEDRPETGPRKELPPQFRRTQVDYFTKEPAGTIVIDTPNTYLYLVLGNGKALRYGIGVGREGFTWTGAEKISRMAEWPDWNPPEQMIERQPYLPRFMAGGATNPLGARALYLGDTLYRIHGTNQPSTIGSFVSSGCIRLTNEDITDLYGRVKVGTRVVVLSGKERANTAAPIASPRAGSTARSSAPSDTNAAAKKRKPPKEPEPQTTTGSARGETTEAHGNTPQTNVKSEHAGFEE
jgi:lipoprotein-anchoring transpeptidase ErfK/SrfK